jgi:hypothetical protein
MMHPQQPNNQNPQYGDRRPIFRSELDMQFLTTDSAWGKSDINQGLKDTLTKSYGYYVADIDEKTGLQKIDKQGKPLLKLVVQKQDLWALLGFYTRDMRLANLSQKDGDMQYCIHYLDLANDFLQEGYIKPFLISLSRVATMLELSQSKGGFLRRRMNTFSQEHINVDVEPEKKNLFGKKTGGQ